MFVAMRADGFAERAARELSATSERVRRPNVELPPQLTAQETQIARLASDGETNLSIGAQLFISPRTVEWHLRKVFNKLGISSLACWPPRCARLRTTVRRRQHRRLTVAALKPLLDR